MRLISKFRDYYDVAQASDIESKPLYMRKNELIKFKSGSYVVNADHVMVDRLGAALTMYEALPSSAYGKRVVLGVCGVLTPAYVWDGYFLRGASELAMLLATRKSDAEWPSDRKAEEKKWRASAEAMRKGDATNWLSRGKCTLKGWKTFEADFSADLAKAHDVVFRDFDVPLFLISSKHGDMVIELNPNLKDLGYHRVEGAFILWQRIDMYLGNQLAKQVDPLPMEDKYRRDAHGFDDKSFKNVAPGERKARRRANKKSKKEKGKA